ncbi:MAG: hypothetical protein ACTS5F_00400 [Candidatus Hodgkinia cicadicola]
MRLMNVGWNFDCKSSLISKLNLQALFGGKISNEKLTRTRGEQ